MSLVTFKHFVFQRGSNLMLRGLTLVAKFALIFLLARYLEPAEVGLYGLLTATILFAIYPLGFDFYTYTTREIIATQRSQWLGLLKNQAALFVLLYAVFLPLFLLIFVFELLPWHLAAFFFALLVTEHLGQEANRLLVAISHPLLAGLVLFIRSGLWVLALVPLLILYPSVRKLEWVLSFWLVFGVIALFVASLPFLKLDRSSLSSKVDWSWLKRGLKVAVPFLVATLAVRLVFTVDRYFLEYLGGLEVVAAYVLFIGIANAMMSFLDAGVFVFYYPKMIQAVKDNDSTGFDRAKTKLASQVVVLCIVFSVVTLLLIQPLLVWLERPLYMEYAYFLPWLLFAFTLNALSMLPHYGLYAAQKDRAIILPHLLAPLVFVVCLYFIQQAQVYAVVYSLVVTMAWLLISKQIFWLFVKRNLFSQANESNMKKLGSSHV